MSGRRAFSLGELVVAAGLALLVLTLLVEVLVPTFRLQARETVRTEIGQMGALALERLVADLRRSAPEGVSLGSGVVGIHRLDTLTDAGTRVWETSLQIYTWDGQRLVCRALPGIDPSRACRLASPVGQGPGQTVASGVTRFALSAAGTGPGLQPPLTISLELEGVVPRGGRERILLERKVNFVN